MSSSELSHENESLKSFKTSKPIIKVNKITKEFPGVIANKEVEIDIYGGEIVSILGENGAGKSTLMKILSGLYKPDQGNLLVDLDWFRDLKSTSSSSDSLTPVHFMSPNDAIDLGIGMVHQHFNLVETMTVVENITLGKEFTSKKLKLFPLLDNEAANNHIKDVSKKYGLEIDPKAIIEDLPVGLKQRVEILKELFRDAKLIIFDEPTAVLTPLEVDELFLVLDELRKSGRTIIFISHKLKEALKISDRIIVMRKGEVIGETVPEKATEEILAEMMVGRRVLLRLNRANVPPGNLVLDVENFSVFGEDKRELVKSISFKVREHEIVGVVGVQGNGQTELLNGLMGITHNVSGTVQYHNSKQTDDWINLAGMSTLKILEKGIAYIPEDRSTQGLISEFQIKENTWLGFVTQPVRAKIYLGDLDKDYVENKHKIVEKKKNKFLLPRKLISRFSSKIVDDLEVATPNVATLIKNLSGGNQQKVILGREFAKNPRLIIASQPTRGVDIGVTERVRNALIEMRNNGSGIFLISSDLDEVLSLSDFILVMYEGKIVGQGHIQDFKIETLSKLMTTGQI